LVISSTGYSKKDYQIPLDENNNLVLDGDNFSQHKIYVKTTYSKIAINLSVSSKTKSEKSSNLSL
jgi:hypothetical protein